MTIRTPLRSLLLAGVSLAALGAGTPVSAAADPCIQQNGGYAPTEYTPAGSTTCTVSATGPVASGWVQTADPATLAPTADVRRIDYSYNSNSTAHLVVEAGSGIINDYTAPMFGNAVVSYGYTDGSRVGKLTSIVNNGVIASTGAAEGSVVSLMQSGDATITNGTTGLISNARATGDSQTIQFGAAGPDSPQFLQTTSASLTVTNDGRIENRSISAGAAAIDFGRTSGNLWFDNKGTIAAYGGAGIATSVQAGSVSVTNAAGATISGYNGLDLMAGRSVIVSNTGRISATAVPGTGRAADDVINGAILLGTDEVAEQSPGFGASGLTIRNERGGVIEATGHQAYGVGFGQAVDGPTHVYNVGSIAATGAGGAAIGATSVEEFVVVSLGSISASGTGMAGVRIEKTGAANSGVANDLDSTVTVTGAGGSGIAIGETGDGRVTITQLGAMTVAGDDGTGIKVGKTNTGVVRIFHGDDITPEAADMKITGDRAAGISLGSIGTGGAEIHNTGTIAASGTGANGILISGPVAGTVVINNDGTIAATGAGSHAINLQSPGGAKATINNKGTVSGTVQLGQQNTMVLHDGSKVVGDIVGNYDSVVMLNGASTITGAVRGNAVSENGLVFNAPSIAAAADGVGDLTIAGGASLVSMTDIGAAGRSLNSLTFSGGTVDLDNNIYYVKLTRIGKAATLKLGGNNDVHGSIVNEGTVDLGSYILNVDGDFATTAGSTVATSAAEGAFGSVKASGTVTLADGTTVKADPAGLSIADGAQVLLADGGTATLGAVNAVDTALVDWSIVRGDAIGKDASDIYLIAKRKAQFGQKAPAGAKGLGNALEQLARSGAGGKAMEQLLDNLYRITDERTLEKELKRLAPDTTGAAQAGASNATRGSFGTVSARGANVRAQNTQTALAGGDGQTGVSTGEMLRGLGVWVQGFGSYGDQGERQGFDGYDYATGGLAVGADTMVLDNARVGLAFTYAGTDVDNDGDLTGNGVNVDSYQAIAYANWQGAPWYVDAALGFGLHQNDATRQTIAGTAEGEFDSRSYTAKLEGGYPVTAGQAVITPVASLEYTYFDTDGYTETGAGAANLVVEDDSSDSLRSGLGATVATTFDAGDWLITPSAKAVWYHEFLDEAPVTTARFAAGGSTFASEGADPANDSVVLGVGLALAQGEQLTLSASYDAELKEDFTSHTALLQARYEF